MVIVIDDLYKNRAPRFYINIAPSLRAERQGLKVMKCNELGKLTGGKWDNMYDQSRRVYTSDGLSPTIHTMGGGNTEIKVAVMENTERRIRKLTPLECWRLMGFEDEDFHKAKQALNDTYYKGRDKSDSQLYKQAGNSIVRHCIDGILTNLLVKKLRSAWLDKLLEVS